MRKTRALAATLIAAVSLISCNSDTAPAGTAATITLRAFVDADGSGAFSTGDVPLAGTVALLSHGVATGLQATLDATGMATLTGVMPGSYTATLTTTAPAGAVLATASQPAVIVPFRGGNIESDFRYVFNPGSISGRIFKDANGNGTFDAATDTPAPGLTVTLYAGTDTTKAPLATTSSGAAGDFTFTQLRAGTYTVKESTFPTIQYPNGTTQQVTVAPAASAPLAVMFTGNLLINIAAVRASPTGTTVAFTGVATVNAALLASNQVYVQDGTAGVLVFGAPTAGILAGDTIRVIGNTSIFNAELEIAAPTGGTLSVTKLGSGAVPAPTTISVAQLIANTSAGQLVKVNGVTVRSVVTTSGTAYNVNMQGATPADTFQVRIGSTVNVPILATAWVVGQSYDVAGLDGYFNGLPQLKPRSAADFNVHVTPLTIAAAKLVLNDTVTVAGIVTATRGTFRTDNAYIQDATSGVQIFNLPLSLTLTLGDSVLVHGKMTVFSNENEITNNVTPTDSIKVTKLATSAAKVPTVITGAQLLARTFEGQLVTVQNVTIVTVGNAGGTGTYSVTGTAPDNSTLTIFMSAPTGAVPPPATTFLVGSKYNITAIAVPFGTPPADELKPRGAADVVKQ